MSDPQEVQGRDWGDWKSPGVTFSLIKAVRFRCQLIHTHRHPIDITLPARLSWTNQAILLPCATPDLTQVHPTSTVFHSMDSMPHPGKPAVVYRPIQVQ